MLAWMILLYFFILGDIPASLKVFSGVKDPTWTILKNNAVHDKIIEFLEVAIKAGTVYKPADMPSRLGYKGIVVDYKAIKMLILGPKTVAASV